MALTAEQKQTRARGIGGSEIASVAGVDPYRGPLDVWLRKTGRVADVAPSHHAERGTYIGPALTEWYAARTGRTVSHRGAHEQTLVCESSPIVIATPDGLVHSAGRGSKVVAVLEVKAPDWRAAHLWGEPGTDEIPDHYHPQVQWEMAAAGVDSAEVAALLSGDLAIYSVSFDGELFAALLEAAERFWRDYVTPDKAPPSDGGETAREWLLQQHPRAVRDVLQGCAKDAAAMRELATVKASIKDLEEREGKLRHQLMAVIGDHEGLVCEAVKVSWRNNKDSQRTDWEALARHLGANDDTIRQFTVTKPGPRVFRAAFSKEG